MCVQAPVIDSCGSAGGRLPGQGNGGFGASYRNTTHAKVGDLGSKTLPVRDTGVIWKPGAQYEVAWTIQAVSLDALPVGSQTLSLAVPTKTCGDHENACANRTTAADIPTASVRSDLRSLTRIASTRSDLRW